MNQLTFNKKRSLLEIRELFENLSNRKRKKSQEKKNPLELKDKKSQREKVEIRIEDKHLIQKSHKIFK